MSRPAQVTTVRIFISYSTADSDVVNRLKEGLAGAGADVWLDHEQLVPGTPNWQIAIREGIEQATHVIYAASETAAISPYVIDEINLARGDDKTVIPFWVRGEKWQKCSPLGFGTTQFTDGRGASFETGMNRLLTTLGLSAEDTGAAQAIPRHPQPKQQTDAISAVLSHSLGITVWDQSRGHHVGRNLITRQSLLPFSCTIKLITTEPAQELLSVRFMEDDVETDEFDLSDARELGSAEVPLPRGLPSGTPIDVTIKLDTEARLLVSALGRQVDINLPI